MGDIGKALGGLPIVGGLLGGGGGGSSQPMGYPPGYGQVQGQAQGLLGGLLGGGGGGGGLLGGLLGGGGGGLGGLLGGLPLIGGMFGGGGGSPFGGLGGMLGGKGIPTPFGQFNPMNPFGGGFNPMNPFGQQQQQPPDWYTKPPSWWNQGPQGAPKPSAPMLKSTAGLQRPAQAVGGGGGSPHVGTVMGDDAGAMYYGGSGAAPAMSTASPVAPQSTSATATFPQRAVPTGSSFVPISSSYVPPSSLPQRSTMTSSMLIKPTAPRTTSLTNPFSGQLPRPGMK